MNYQNVFKRYEIKFLISREQFRLIEDATVEYLRPDQFARSQISNIYFDTPDMRLIRRSIEKPLYKEKLRLRAYGEPTEKSLVFVELKKKYKHVVYKRRVEMILTEASDYLLAGIRPEKGGQIINEIDYFLKFYSGLEASMFVAYERTSFRSREDAGLRLTFDENILWRDTDLSLCLGAYGHSLLDPDNVLMEIKTNSTIPLWFTGILTKNQIYKSSFSKYGNAYKAKYQELLRCKAHV
ncbi:MAG TPA: polyphosphate polymerase domain-containing protein [Clostridiaceae bacterium]|nr:polyphosphate polymerase domain-containing protein [Clostridiaceae bacterium]